MRITTIELGIDVLQQQNFEPLVGKRVGLFTNGSGVDSQLRSTYDILWEAENVNLVAIFAPEHGFAGAEQAGESIDTQTDPRTGILAFSLYGATYAPTADMMNAVDVIVVDIQDIGIRYYTFMWTMTYILEACGKYGVEMLILDRPNPLRRWFAKPVLDMSVSSLVGRFPVPVVHGLTIGEMARLVNGEWLDTSAELDVIPCHYYKPHMDWNEVGLYWIAPSPNMPSYSTIVHYAGSCLIEGTNLSEGRGTTLPFEVIGAPWVDSHQLANIINQEILQNQVTDIIARPHSFKPVISKYANEVCHGIQLHVYDYEVFDAVSIWLDIIDTIRKLYPEDFEWLPPYQDGGHYHFDRLIGIPDFRLVENFNEALETESVDDDMDMFMKLRQKYLLYNN